MTAALRERPSQLPKSSQIRRATLLCAGPASRNAVSQKNLAVTWTLVELSLAMAVKVGAPTTVPRSLCDVTKWQFAAVFASKLPSSRDVADVLRMRLRQPNGQKNCDHQLEDKGRPVEGVYPMYHYVHSHRCCLSGSGPTPPGAKYLVKAMWSGAAHEAPSPHFL